MKTFSLKNRDYGDSYKVDGIVGVVVRLGDKLKRLKKISKDGYQIQVVEEGLQELLGDIANYALMGLLLIKENVAVDEEVGNNVNKQKLVQQGKDNTDCPYQPCTECFAQHKACTRPWE